MSCQLRLSELYICMLLWNIVIIFSVIMMVRGSNVSSPISIYRIRMADIPIILSALSISPTPAMSTPTDSPLDLE